MIRKIINFLQDSSEKSSSHEAVRHASDGKIKEANTYVAERFGRAITRLADR